MTEKGLSQKYLKYIELGIGLIVTFTGRFNWIENLLRLLPMRKADLKYGIGMALFLALVGWFIVVRRRIHIAWVGGVGVSIFISCHYLLILTDWLWKILENEVWINFVMDVLQPLIWGLGYATLGTIAASMIVSLLQQDWYTKNPS